MLAPMQAGSLAAMKRLQSPTQPRPLPQAPAQPQAPAPQPQAPAPQQPVAQPPPAPVQPQAPQPPPISSFKEGGPMPGAQPLRPPTPPQQMPMQPGFQPKTAPSQSAMNRSAAMPQQTTQTVRKTARPQAPANGNMAMIRQVEQSNLRGRQKGRFQEGLQKFGGDQTQALYYALKYGA